MTALKIRKVGNSLGVILPKEIQEELELFEGDILELTKISEKRVLLETPLAHHSKWTFEGAEKLTQEETDWLEADLDEGAHVPKW
ncbi:MAG: AbrB/MazE/SpoVT family DNA-binding domain-containing protein [Bdellovibrionales bacterium]|nr:AbrB/MazE/SpoVT family DNA-binding domain-containing protein [Bdellovibrionales bacterium]